MLLVATVFHVEHCLFGFWLLEIHPWVCYIQGFSSTQKKKSKPLLYTHAHVHTHTSKSTLKVAPVIKGQSMSDVQRIDRAFCMSS